MNPVLAATSISVRIGAKTLLDDVSLSLDFGEIVALVGPNGAGKSTLLRVLSGDLAPHAGTVLLNGRTLASYGPRALADRRAVLSQSLNVAFPFTVAEIVRMGAGDGRGRESTTWSKQHSLRSIWETSTSGSSPHYRGASSNARISPGCWFSSHAGKRRMVRACFCSTSPRRISIFAINST